MNDIPTPSELLHSFIDGDLDTTSEQQLFSTLAGSSELRAEMRDLLAMKTAVNGDMEAFTPPVATTKALFASLGFAAPIAAPAPAPVEVPPANVIPMPAPAVTAGAVAAGSKVVGFIHSIWAPIMSAAVAAGLVGIVMTNMYQDDISTLEARNNSAQKQIALLKEARYNSSLAHNKIAETPTNNVVASSSALADNSSFKTPSISNNTKLLKEIEYRDRQIASLLKENGSLKESAVAATMPVISAPEGNTLTASISHAPVENALGISVKNTAMQLPGQQFLPGIEEEGGINFSEARLYVRGIAARSFPDPTDENLKTESLLNNTALGCFAGVTENLSLGVEIGQETFGQKFQGTAANGRVYEYEQSPNLFWGAAGARYRFLKAETSAGDIEVFSQGMIGGTTLGPIAKALTGIEYKVGHNISMMAGVEATVLSYTYQSNQYFTRKLGLTYGMAYNF